MKEFSEHITIDESDKLRELIDRIGIATSMVHCSFGDDKRGFADELLQLQKEYTDYLFKLAFKYAPPEYIELNDPIAPAINFITNKIMFPIMQNPRMWRNKCQAEEQKKENKK